MIPLSSYFPICTLASGSGRGAGGEFVKANKSMSIPKPIIPNEHGAWAVLFVPMIVASTVAGAWTFELICLAFSALGVFMSYVPLQFLMKSWMGDVQNAEKLKQSHFWSAVYLGFGIAWAVPILMKGFVLLPAFGILGAIFFLLSFALSRRFKKNILSDSVSVLGLTLSAPGAYYVATGVLDQTALLLWLWSVLFFECGVFYVHMKIKALGIKKTTLTWKEKLAVGRLNVLYHVLAVVAVAFLTAQFGTPRLVIVAFVPMVVHAIYGTLNLSSRVRFKNLGFLLLAQSFLFAGMIAAAY